MVDIPDIDLSGRNIGSLNLGVTTQTEIGVALREELGVDGPVRIVTRHATLAQGGVLKDKRPRLFTVTWRAGLITARHGQAARRLHYVRAMGIVTLHAAHLLLQHRVVLWQMTPRFG